MTQNSVDTAERRHTQAIEAVRQAELAVGQTRERFEQLVARHAVGETKVSESDIDAARRDRHAATERLERAVIAERAAGLALQNAKELARQAAVDADWRRVEILGSRYKEQAQKLEALLQGVDQAAHALLELGAEISAVSPRAQARPDVVDLSGSRLRGRLQKAAEFTLTQIYPQTAEGRYTFPGLTARLCEPLSFFVVRDVGA